MHFWCSRTTPTWCSIQTPQDRQSQSGQPTLWSKPQRRQPQRRQLLRQVPKATLRSLHSGRFSQRDTRSWRDRLLLCCKRTATLCSTTVTPLFGQPTRTTPSTPKYAWSCSTTGTLCCTTRRMFHFGQRVLRGPTHSSCCKPMPTWCSIRTHHREAIFQNGPVTQRLLVFLQRWASTRTPMLPKRLEIDGTASASRRRSELPGNHGRATHKATTTKLGLLPAMLGAGHRGSRSGLSAGLKMAAVPVPQRFRTSHPLPVSLGQILPSGKDNRSALVPSMPICNPMGTLLSTTGRHRCGHQTLLTRVATEL